MPTCVSFIPSVLPVMPVSCDTQRHPWGHFTSSLYEALCYTKAHRDHFTSSLYEVPLLLLCSGLVCDTQARESGGEIISQDPLLDKQLPGAVIFNRVFLSWDRIRASPILKVVIELSPKGGS